MRTRSTIHNVVNRVSEMRALMRFWIVQQRKSCDNSRMNSVCSCVIRRKCFHRGTCSRLRCSRHLKVALHAQGNEHTSVRVYQRQRRFVHVSGTTVRTFCNRAILVTIKTKRNPARPVHGCEHCERVSVRIRLCIRLRSRNICNNATSTGRTRNHRATNIMLDARV